MLEGSHLPPGHLQLLRKLNLGSQLDFAGWLLSEVCPTVPQVAVAISGFPRVQHDAERQNQRVMVGSVGMACVLCTRANVEIQKHHTFSIGTHQVIWAEISCF